MHPHPITPNIKLEIEFLPVVYQQLEAASKGLNRSKTYIIHQALIKALGLEGIVLPDRTVWGAMSRTASAEG